MDKYLRTNLANWNARVPVHARSRFYDVAGFKRGRTSLKPLELKEVGSVKGKTLLHLQCHFGMDTLSWARLGAKVTGVDFSGKAIAEARALAEETAIPATFVCSDVYALPQVLRGKFDIVFASYGVLCWISDIKRWMAVAAHFLKPGGKLYIVEDHPFMTIFDQSGKNIEVPYFKTGPLSWPAGPTYTDNNGETMPPTYEWLHPVSGILDAVSSSGLKLEFFREFPFCAYERFTGMRKRRDGFYVLPDRKGSLPLLFSLKAAKL